MSATQFRDLVESILLQYLHEPYRRADMRLTAAERERTEKCFGTTWDLAHRLGARESAPDAERELDQTKLQDLLCLKEIASFLLTNITAADREKIASSAHQEGQTAARYDDSQLDRGATRILQIFNDRIVEERGGSYPIPEGAPLNLFSFFDDWQGDVENVVPWED